VCVSVPTDAIVSSGALQAVANAIAESSTNAMNVLLARALNRFIAAIELRASHTRFISVPLHWGTGKQGSSFKVEYLYVRSLY
jgi:hypothetical protein